MPLLVPNPKKTAAAAGKSVAGGFVPDPEAMMMIQSMGFDEAQAKRALRKCEGNLERAVDWIMSHLDEPDSEEEGAGSMVVDEVS